jgi:hypothetical protein
VFKPTPYWMGYYASRPALKKYHFEITQLLLNTEFLNTLLKTKFNGIN